MLDTSRNIKRKQLFYSVLAVLCLCVCLKQKVYASPSLFKELKKRSLQIPTFRNLYAHQKINGAGSLNDKLLYKKMRLVSLEQFEATLDQFFPLMEDLLKDPQSWLTGVASVPCSQELRFMPYAQKLVKDQGTRCMFKGDLHGDIHSLLAALDHLQDMGVMSSSNPLKIEDPSFHLIFLGDYVDRGLWGTEVLLLLMLLKITNPHQVVLLRGNHEDPLIASSYGFHAEFFSKFSDSSLKDRERCYQKICAFYEYLPVVLYVGAGTNKRMNFVQCCHGGLEIGYNPKKLLQSSHSVSFQALGSLKQLEESKKLPPFLVEGPQRLPLKRYCKDCMPTSPFELGFLWNDFVVDAQELSRYHPQRGFAFNKEVTRAVLKAASTKNNRLIGVIRAHQHTPSNSNPMMRLLLSSYGCASLWNSQKENLKFTEGTVLTLLLSPDSLHGQPKKFDYDGFTYDTSLLLTLSLSLQDWNGKVLNNPLYEKRKALKKLV